MRVLLDEDMPHALRRASPSHELVTVRYAGLSGIENGELLRRAMARGFEAFITLDRGIEHQQHVPALDLAVIIIAVPDMKVPMVLRLVPEIIAVLDAEPQPGTLTVVGTWRT